jgi:hypothetical protein
VLKQPKGNFLSAFSLAGSLACWVIGHFTGQRWLLVLAIVGALMALGMSGLFRR